MGDTGITQLQVYEVAIENCSDRGNRAGVEMFGGLIVELVKERKKIAIKKLEVIDGKDVLTEIDSKNRGIHKNNIVIYDGWLGAYSVDSSRYKGFLSQADVNSWKQGKSPFG